MLDELFPGLHGRDNLIGNVRILEEGFYFLPLG